MKRNTLNKQIASAPTFADKWQVLANGGRPATDLEMNVFWVTHFRLHSGPGHKLPADVAGGIKAQFADALFPALVSGDKKPFKQLMEIMDAANQTQGNLYSYLLRKNKLDTPTKQDRLKLKWALANVEVEDRVSIKAACDYLNKLEVKYRDASDVWHTLRQVGRPLLKPGDRVQWFVNFKWSKKKEAGMTRIKQGEGGQWLTGKLAREDWMTQEGKLASRGITREQLSRFRCKCFREVRAL